jgi:hypothetical protein
MVKKRTMEVEEMIKLYEQGKSTTEIALMANVTARYVRLILKDKEVEKRAFEHWKRVYALNEDYFKTWSKTMAYILGFFSADGVVVNSTQSISFAQKDKDILEQIKKEIGTQQPIIQNSKTGVYLLTINSKVMKNDLMKLHGINPNKSLNIKFPYVPEEYLSHFVRGYFDGDGCIYKNKNFVNIVGGSLEFLQELYLIFEELNFNPVLKDFGQHYRIYISGYENIKRFSSWIYKDKDLMLQRKFDRFQENITAWEDSLKSQK